MHTKTLTELFGGNTTDRYKILHDAVSSGYHVTINANYTNDRPLCTLRVKEVRLEREHVRRELMELGRLKEADSKEHPCGVHHAISTEVYANKLHQDNLERAEWVVKWLTNNRCELGLHVGRNRIVVVNCDGQDQINRFLSIMGYYIEPTVYTPGTAQINLGARTPADETAWYWKHEPGAHFYFYMPEGLILPVGNYKQTTEGWSVVYGDAQVMVPPSTRPEGKYKLGSGEIMPMPQFLAEYIQALVERGRKLNGPDPLLPGQVSPFQEMALTYKAAGYPPLPLAPNRTKAAVTWKPAQSKLIGSPDNGAIELTTDEISDLMKAPYYYGVGIRIPKGYVALDVDAYGGKSGKESLSILEAQLGPLPCTYRNTARYDDPVSGHRIFRCDKKLGSIRIGVDDSHIDILDYTRRYANVYPTVNWKTGDSYRWISPDGDLMPEGFIPPLSDLPDLPERWVNHLAEKERPPVTRTEPAPLSEKRRAVQILKGLLRQQAARTEGNRHIKSYGLAAYMGQMNAAGYLDEDKAIEWHRAANVECGLPDDEIRSTFQDGFRRGQSEPLTLDMED